MTITTRRAMSSIASVAVAVALTSALSGCGLFPASGGADGPSPSASPTQTVAEACSLVRESVQDAADQLGSLDTSDPQAAFAALTAVSQRVHDAAAAVDNTDVAALLPGLESGFSAAADALQATAGGDLSKLPALQQAAADIQTSLGGFAELCPVE